MPTKVIDINTYTKEKLTIDITKSEKNSETRKINFKS